MDFCKKIVKLNMLGIGFGVMCVVFKLNVFSGDLLLKIIVLVLFF